MQAIPKHAQQEVYDFFLFLKQRYSSNLTQESETLAFSNHSANLIEEWKNEEEDAVWK